MDIELEGIRKRMNPDFTLSIPTLEIRSPRVFGVVGNNGAGKTTLLSILAGLRGADAGTVRAGDIRLEEKHLDWWKSRIGVYLDETFMFDYFTAFEHFRFVAEAWGVEDGVLEERVALLEPTFHLEPYYQQRIAALSAGNRKKVGLLGTLIAQPPVLIWDEPFSGLDPRSQEQLKTLLVRYKDEIGAAVIVSSHDLVHVAEICDEVVSLSDGRIELHVDQKISYEELRSLFVAESVAPPAASSRARGFRA